MAGILWPTPLFADCRGIFLSFKNHRSLSVFVVFFSASLKWLISASSIIRLCDPFMIFNIFVSQRGSLIVIALRFSLAFNVGRLIRFLPSLGVQWLHIFCPLCTLYGDLKFFQSLLLLSQALRLLSQYLSVVFFLSRLGLCCPMNQRG